MIEDTLRNQCNEIAVLRRKLEKAVREARETLTELEDKLNTLNTSF